jgi:hypothetical protein
MGISSAKIFIIFVLAGCAQTVHGPCPSQENNQMGISRTNDHLLEAGDTLVGNLVSPIASGWLSQTIITSPDPAPDHISVTL